MKFLLRRKATETLTLRNTTSKETAEEVREGQSLLKPFIQASGSWPGGQRSKVTGSLIKQTSVERKTCLLLKRRMKINFSSAVKLINQFRTESNKDEDVDGRTSGLSFPLENIVGGGVWICCCANLLLLLLLRSDGGQMNIHPPGSSWRNKHNSSVPVYQTAFPVFPPSDVSSLLHRLPHSASHQITINNVSRRHEICVSLFYRITVCWSAELFVFSLLRFYLLVQSFYSFLSEAEWTLWSGSSAS